MNFKEEVAIRTPDKESSKKLQEFLFERGYSWFGDVQTPKFLDKDAIVIPGKDTITGTLSGSLMFVSDIVNSVAYENIKRKYTYKEFESLYMTDNSIIQISKNYAI